MFGHQEFERKHQEKKIHKNNRRKIKSTFKVNEIFVYIILNL